jgi:RNA polymerase sigma factor (TIGR02999 family)
MAERINAGAPMERTPAQDDVTRLLRNWRKGDERARDQLLVVVYGELRRLARGYMRHERRNHTLQPTALVHEAYMRLVEQEGLDWRNRAQFLGLAAVIMRRILVSHARNRVAGKRGGRAQKISLAFADETFERPDVEVLAVHEAIDKLAALDRRKSQIVELKFFGGLTTKEIGEALHISIATVEREWSFARAWLSDAIAGDRRPPRP